jgi:hypothetical protein
MVLLTLHSSTAPTVLMPPFIKIRAHKCSPPAAITNGGRSNHRGSHPFEHGPVPTTLVCPFIPLSLPSFRVPVVDPA